MKMRPKAIIIIVIILILFIAFFIWNNAFLSWG